MPSICIRFFVQEGMRYAHRPIHEWLFDEAKAQGITGGTVFRAAAGYGRHGIHEDSFFELAGELPEAVEFFAEAGRIEALIARIGEAGLTLRYMHYPVTVGVTPA